MDKVKQLIRPEVLELSAYAVPQANGMIKLDAMENPYTWPDHIQREWLECLSQQSLNRYPDPIALPLKNGLRQAMNIPPELDLMLGNGSDELIQIIAMAVNDQNKNPQTGQQINNVMLGFEPGFVMYKMVARYLSMHYETVPLNAKDFSIDIDVTLRAIKQHKPALIFIAYPNNPTGNLFDQTSIERIIDCAPGLVVIDEAYQPFSQQSFLSRLSNYNNVLLMRTVSKMGLAGLRLGYLIGKPEWISQLDKLRLPYNINILTQFCAEFALQHIEELYRQLDLIREQREVVYHALKALDYLTVYPSVANFILLRTADGQAQIIYRQLQENNILIKNLDGAHPMLKDCLRVTIGKPEENRQFLQALQAVILN